MSLQINPQNIDDVFKIFGFLKEYNIPFHIPPDSIAPLMKMLEKHALETYKDILSNTPLSNLCTPVHYDEVLLLPKTEFKHFCGSEWIINGKYITEKIIFDRIDHHARVNNLRNGMYLHLDKTLQQLLCTDKIAVNDSELRGLFKNTCWH